MVCQKHLVSLVTRMEAATLLVRDAGGRPRPRRHLEEWLSRVVYALYRRLRVIREVTHLVALIPSGDPLLHLRSRLDN